MLSRRLFIQKSIKSLVALAVPPLIQACGETSATPIQQSKVKGPDLVIARNGEPDVLIERALSAFGGISSFVSKGSTVVIKPNICVAYHSYEYAATTNPWLVGALVKMSLAAGAKSVKVMDFPFGGTPEEAYVISGIEGQVKAAGGEMVVMTGFKFKPSDIPGIRLKKADVFDDILTADVLINVPIAKHHSLARITAGMKNLLGVVKDRPALHFDLGQNLSDLSGFIRPALTIIDAIRILTANGPTGGNLDDVQKLDTIILSTDIVAADAFTSTLFGMKQNDLNYVRAGVQSGLGRSDLENMKIEEINAGS